MKKAIKTALSISIIYIILGLLWVIFSDNILRLLVSDFRIYSNIGKIMGCIFVIITGLILLFLIFTQRNIWNRKINRMLYFDPITGLANHNLLIKHGENLIKNKKPFILLYFDIDNFKHIIDTVGHQIGDDYLKSFADRFKECLPNKTLFARLSGDEFVAVLEEGKSNVENIVNCILKQVRRPWSLGNQEIYTSISMGIVSYPDQGDNFEELMKKSDIAMYYSKRNGKDKYSFFTQELEDRAATYANTINDLHRGLKNQEFRLLYQPIVNIPSGGLKGVEALIRWHHPEKGLISPASFIPIAEDTGQINNIGYWVIETAFNQKMDWEDKGLKGILMSINISGKSLLQPGFIEKIKHLLNHYNLRSEEIQFEITESIFLDKMDKSVNILTQLSNLGIKIALDDFGTGYSSLTYLKNLPIDVVKLDHSFVKGISSQGEDKVIVESVIKLTHDLGLSIVAEGIETDEHLELLSKQSCDYGQGYLFSRPVSSEEIEKKWEAFASR